MGERNRSLVKGLSSELIRSTLSRALRYPAAEAVNTYPPRPGSSCSYFPPSAERGKVVARLGLATMSTLAVTGCCVFLSKTVPLISSFFATGGGAIGVRFMTTLIVVSLFNLGNRKSSALGEYPEREVLRAYESISGTRVSTFPAAFVFRVNGFWSFIFNSTFATSGCCVFSLSTVILKVILMSRGLRR